MRRARAPGALALAAVALWGAACERPVAPHQLRARLAALERPNLVLLVVDTLRPDFTSAYGFESDTTPELAQWARRGVVFERARAQSSWTKVSMASLLTGLWPRTLGLRASEDGLGAAVHTLAERLRETGYATYAVQTNGWLDQSFGFHQGFERYAFPLGGGAARLPRPMVWPHADRVVEEASRILAQHDPARPFFLYLHFMDVHEYAAPAEFKRFGSGERADYLAAIRWVDDAIARVRAALAAGGALERSVLVFTSDHGEAFGEHGLRGHARDVLTATLWVPLVLRLPFPVEPIRVASQVRGVDVAPTLLELAGVAVPAELEGRSLLPLLAGGSEGEPDRPSFASLPVRLFADARVGHSVNDGQWLYARDEAAARAERLFDRGIDPGEDVNLIGIEPRARERGRALLDAHLARPPGDDLREARVRIAPEVAQRLRALGYLD